jgi:hypothetical protein
MKLEEYYRRIVNAEELMNQRWINNYYDGYNTIIQDNNYKVAVEVGVGYGTHAKSILQNTDIRCLYLIDPMRKYENNGFDSDILACFPMTSNQFDDMYGLINEYLYDYRERYKWIRKSTPEVLSEDIADDSVDCVFINSFHCYRRMVDNLEFWWKKVCARGKLIGNNYLYAHVKNALDDFTHKIGIQYELVNDNGTGFTTYCIRK